MLKKASHETNDGEAAKSSHCYIIQSSHHEKVFDDGNKNRHHWKLLLPIQKGLVSSQTGFVIEAKVDLETSILLDKFNDRYFCPIDDLYSIVSGYALFLEKICKAEEHRLGSLIGETIELSWVISTVSYEIHEVDISCREKQSSSMGAECMQFSRLQPA